jgi:hypothetical protein
LALLAVILIVDGAFAATSVAMQLVLAVDVSGSVSQDRFELQREGYAAAFRSAAVLQAIRSTSTGSIAVAMLQWTGPALHVVAVDWTLIDDAASAERFAAAVRNKMITEIAGGGSREQAVDVGLCEVGRGCYIGRFDRRVVHHARQHGLDLLQVFDSAANPLAGEILKGAGLENRVDLLGHGGQSGRIATRLQPAGDGFRCLHDLVCGVLGGLHHRLQLDAAVVRRRYRRGDDMGDLLMDARQLRRQIGLTVVDQLHRGVNLHAQLGDAPVDETTELVELRADGGAHKLFKGG